MIKSQPLTLIDYIYLIGWFIDITDEVKNVYSKPHLLPAIVSNIKSSATKSFIPTKPHRYTEAEVYEVLGM